MTYRASILIILFSISTGSNAPGNGKIDNVFGIDFSHHQKNIQWSKIDSESVRFAYIKATEGRTFHDTRFLQYSDSLGRLNIPWSAYHYFTFCADPRRQAQNFVNRIKSKPFSLIPAVDVEFKGNCSKVPTRDSLNISLNRFQQVVYDSLGVKPIVYTTVEFYNQYFLGGAERKKYWIRSFDKNPESFFPSDWIIWQYGIGKVAGFPAKVDLNRLNTGKYSLEDLKITNNPGFAPGR